MAKSSTTGSGGSHFQASGDVLKVVKLKTGEIILCSFDEEVQDFSYAPTINLINPIIILTLKAELENGAMTNESLAIKPFLSLSDSTVFPISTDVIITMGNMKAEARRIYLDYVQNIQHHQLLQQDEIKVLDLLRSVSPGGKVTIIESPNEPTQ